ncbi:hypothetical protein M378DRAFT_8433 [Amanita muscaria Koide BX008]|uniref:Uncharacterized protein n=1 Tax=Amanita muscaria (strain Koide BX008) TaxID=946122 RepID=A0A0C2SZR7_AMAMK|nr:hypothetical protein M378DRAFT_8433 [Amanita muscaria Koide BX008]
MANDFQRNFMARGMHGNMGVVPGIAQPELKTTASYSYNNEGINSSIMSISDTTFDYMNDNAMNSTHGLYGAMPSNSNNIYSTPNHAQSRIQQLETKLLLAQSDAMHWKESYHMLLSRIGTPSGPTFAVPTSRITSPVISSIKTEYPSLTGTNHHELNVELKPAEFLHARNDLLQVLFAPAFTPHQNHEELDPEDHPLISYWHASDYNVNVNDNLNSQLSDKIAYLEDESGYIVDKKRITTIRADLRSTFNQILSNMPRVLHGKWSQYDMEFQQAVYRYLRTKYVEFTFCEGNWKAKSFLSNWYSNWMRNLKKKEHHQDVSKAGKAANKTIPSKRRSDEIPGPSTTRQCSESEASIPRPSTSGQRSESEVPIPRPLASRQRSESEASTSVHQSSEDKDMPPRIGIANNLRLKQVPLTVINLADKEDNESSIPSSTRQLPITDNLNLDGVLDKTGDEDTCLAPALALSIPFHVANSLLAENDTINTTTTMTHMETQATTSHTEVNCTSNKYQAETSNIAAIASPVDTMNTDAGTLATINATNIQGTTKKTGGNRKRRIYPNSTTAENLFAIDFQLSRGGSGTNDQFNLAWQALSAQDRQSYQERSATLSSQKKTGK